MRIAVLRRVFQILHGAIAAGGQAGALTLDEAHKSDFFNFFCLEQSCAPETTDMNRIWRCFRPSGPNFRPMVELAVLTDQTGRIVCTRLGVDRTFVDHPTNGAFARDIAKSYLLWALPPRLSAEVKTLIANISDLRGAPVLMRTRGPPPSDSTGGYDVYRGARDRVELLLSGAQLVLTNVDGFFPANQIYAVAACTHLASRETLSQRRRRLWLAIDVTEKALPPVLT